MKELNQMKLSPAEQKLILKHRQKEDLNKPKKIGYLKHDLYGIGRCELKIVLPKWYCTDKEKEQAIKEFHDKFHIIPAGTKFECYINEFDNEEWYDTYDGHLSNMDKCWAKEHLRDISDIPKKKQ